MQANLGQVPIFSSIHLQTGKHQFYYMARKRLN